MARNSASICLRGHYDNTLLEGRDSTVRSFCSICGAPVITQCPDCGGRILGSYVGVLSANFRPRDFCNDCGGPYPWADRDAHIAQLRNLLEFEPGLDNAERLELIEQIAVLSKPDVDEKTRIKAGEKIKQLAPRGWAMAGPVLRSLLTAEILRRLGLPPG